MELYVEDTVEPSGHLELLQDQAAAKRIAAALVADWELSLLPLRLPRSMCGGGVGEVCLCG